MATKIYKSAMGRVVDLGALILENESTRAVGNMNTNARGDLIDGANRVLETKPKQVQKHYQKQITNTTANVPTSSTLAAKKQHAQKKMSKEKIAKDTSRPLPAKEKVVNESVLDSYNDERLVSKFDKIQKIPAVPVDIDSMEELSALADSISDLTIDSGTAPEPTKTVIPRGGLAAAIAKTQSVKQELMKTPRQLVQSKPGVNKI
jgi:hypothetical protein